MEITDSIKWKRIYWVRGDTPRGRQRNAVKDPPCSGWQHAIILPAAKRSTIFCPYTLDAFTVPNDCAELTGAEEPRDEITAKRLAARIQEKWTECQSLGWSRDYDTAALVLRKLGAEVPAQIMRGGEEDTRKRGGKEVGVELVKPVKLSGKRGKFLEWFLQGGGSRSVREAMAEFGMSRSNALSYLYMLRKDHGIGYELVGDVATVQLPAGCSNPFDVEWATEASEASEASEVSEASEADEDDDSWLDGEGKDEDDDSWLE